MSSTPGGKPRPATAAAASTTRSIQAVCLAGLTSGSVVSHCTGSAGPTVAWTMLAMEECEDTIPQIARVAAAELAMTLSTRSSSLPCCQR